MRENVRFFDHRSAEINTDFFKIFRYRREFQIGLACLGLSMNPHLTLTLSTPIGWERRGNRQGRWFFSGRNRFMPQCALKLRLETFQEPQVVPGITERMPQIKIALARVPHSRENCGRIFARDDPGPRAHGFAPALGYDRSPLSGHSFRADLRPLLQKENGSRIAEKGE